MGLDQREKVLRLQINTELIATLKRRREKKQRGVGAHVLQQLVRSNDVVAVRLKAGQSGWRALLHILQEENGKGSNEIQAEVSQYRQGL